MSSSVVCRLEQLANIIVVVHDHRLFHQTTGQIDVLPFVEAVVSSPVCQPTEEHLLSSCHTVSAEEKELDWPTSSSQVLYKRQMAFISPRLGVCNNVPFAFNVRI
jgi:hypothetical protein